MLLITVLMLLDCCSHFYILYSYHLFVYSSTSVMLFTRRHFNLCHVTSI